SIICAFAAIIVYIIATIAKWYVEKQPFDFESLIAQTELLLSAGLFFSSVNYPILFKLGVDKGRMWFILMTVIIAGGSSSLLALVKADPMKVESLVQKVTPFMLPVAVGLLLISVVLSIRIYEKREF
ncbi:MAG: ABC-2 transporter permease, partial [Clostridiaceae bacterium]|nr:ABC-2 transporter permease [Clostridiaceae bacterium]